MAKMSKEEIKGGVAALFGEAPKEEQPTLNQSSEETDVINTLSDEELREAAQAYRNNHRGRPKRVAGTDKATEYYERVTTIAHKEKMAKIREIAKREHLQIKDVLEAMMDEAIATYEAKFGVIRVFPETGHGDKATLFKK